MAFSGDGEAQHPTYTQSVALSAGNLFAAMNVADSEGLIQYIFPEGPLPVLTQVSHANEQSKQGVQTNV